MNKQKVLKASFAELLEDARETRAVCPGVDFADDGTFVSGPLTRRGYDIAASILDHLERAIRDARMEDTPGRFDVANLIVDAIRDAHVDCLGEGLEAKTEAEYFIQRIGE